MSKKVNIEIDVQAVIDAVQETFNGPDAGEIADELFERVVDKIESNLDSGDIARDLDLGDIAGEIDISELAEEIDLKELAEHIELDALAERLADHMQRKLLKDWNVKETVETVVEQKLGVQLAGMRAETTDELFERVCNKVESNIDLVSLANMDLERRALRSAVEDLRAEVEALKAPIAALRPLFKFMEALKS